MKRWISIAAVVSGLALAPAAYAQGSCSDITRTVNEARSDFVSITGEELADFSYAATFEMPNASACTISVEWDSLYQCLWVHETESAARTTFDALTSTAASCLAGWKTESVLDELPLPETAVAHLVRSGADDFQDIEVLIHLNRYEEQGQVDWEVWYEVYYYLL